MRANYKLQRLYLNKSLSLNMSISLDERQSHYISHVLRMKEGETLLLFNGIDGEWVGEISEIKKKQTTVTLIREERCQTEAGDLIYCFAPLKHARLDYMIQKAVEMGASIIQPVITQFTQVSRVNGERIEANIIEAAEQCGVLSIAKYREPRSLIQLLKEWEPQRHLIFCDEAAQTQNPLEILNKMKPAPVGILIGPEGGFSDEERKLLRGFSFVTSIPLGPRILRADTAAVAALTVVNATLGDWQDKPCT